MMIKCLKKVCIQKLKYIVDKITNKNIYINKNIMKDIFIMITIILIILYGLYISKVTMFNGVKKIIIDRPYNKLLIVAHPDDETLWGYYQLKNSKGWKILCVTNANNSTRVNELKNIANNFDAALEIWNYQDSAFHYNMHPQLYKDIKNEIDKPNVKMVLTHNPLGEYGHIQHIKVSNVVLTVSKKPTYVFSYTPNHKSNKNEICDMKKYYKSQDKIFQSHCQKIIKNKIYCIIR